MTHGMGRGSKESEQEGICYLMHGHTRVYTHIYTCSLSSGISNQGEFIKGKPHRSTRQPPSLSTLV